MKKKKVFEAAAAVLSCAALAVMLAGCGQSSSTSASSSQASSSSPAGGSSGESKSSSPAPSASSSASPSGSQSASSASSSSSQSGKSGSASQSQETGSAPQNSTSGSAPQSTSGTSSSASLTHYSQDPSVPLPKAISPSIPDSATVIGPDYAQLPNGKVVNLSNGQEVTNPKIVGTATTPPDPGAASGGMNFIPEQVGSVRSQMKKLQESQEGSAGTSAYVVKTAAYIPNGNYGAFWSSNSNGEAFYDGQGNLFVQQAKGVIDVSAWNGDVNWAELKNEGVQGAIIRLDYGSYNGYDSEALNNIDQCLKLGIPIGVYVYSYAYNSQVAYGEGSYAATLLKQAGLSPSQLPLGIYYDLEAYSWYAHPHPTSPQVYQGIVSSFFDALSADGYTNASVYSYPEYLETELNNSYIYQHVGWIASYSWVPGFNQWNTNFRGWQYSDEGEMAGINGYVDLDAFGYASYSPIAWTGPLNLSSYPIADLPDGDYYIDLASDLSTSLQAPSGQEGIQMNAAAGDRSQGQIWYLHRNPNGSYGILNTLGNYWLDVWQGNMTPGNKIDQWDGNGLPTQQWFI
ncbi:MAG: RICIN domain-containing protein, partial [Aeriscardovia sp.]|nr:RICIN domain-containing protein [Aeriscardovia sp.]